MKFLIVLKNKKYLKFGYKKNVDKFSLVFSHYFSKIFKNRAI